MIWALVAALVAFIPVGVGAAVDPLQQRLSDRRVGRAAGVRMRTYARRPYAYLT